MSDKPEGTRVFMGRGKAGYVWANMHPMYYPNEEATLFTLPDLAARDETIRREVVEEARLRLFSMIEARQGAAAWEKEMKDEIIRTLAQNRNTKGEINEYR